MLWVANLANTKWGKNLKNDQNPVVNMCTEGEREILKNTYMIGLDFQNIFASLCFWQK